MNKNRTLVFVIFAVVFVGIIILVIVNAIRRREITFEGEVIDKNIIENRQANTIQTGGASIVTGGGVTHTYKIKVKTDAGKQINYKISEGMYETIKIGDRVSKPKGTDEVTILSSSKVASPAQPDATQTGTIPPVPPINPPTPTNPAA